ncbi:hypothetical protein E1A91_D09G163700v1 [Gossypium mustelinum]|uniref:Uncharacterized protein n=1 Tax=Gossypium mustelinum TaxID=34275 RepID=A0A5D2TMU7_GOSMU|nr:hypothetical protein E1A91_D09G163700v1 [Gossypium mustelinum]
MVVATRVEFLDSGLKFVHSSVGAEVLCGIIICFRFGFGVPLFIDNSKHPRQIKWGLWVVHRLVLTAIYDSILFMYHSKWRERLYITTIVCYHAFYLPFLYITFLPDFFEVIIYFHIHSKKCICLIDI